MKRRMGFVSNSSSSSFVVALPFIPQNINEMKTILFGDKKEYMYDYYDGIKSFTTLEIAKTVFNDFAEQLPNKKEELIEVILSGWFEGHLDCNDDVPDPSDREKYDNYWIERDKKNKEIATNLWDKFYKQNKDSYFYSFSYSDGDGAYGSALEHGGLFENLPHIVINQH